MIGWKGQGLNMLVGAIDDATNDVPISYFQEREDTKGYSAMLRALSEAWVFPGFYIHDRHSTLRLSGDTQKLD